MIKLGVNIDHVATIRNARGEGHPDIIRAAKYVINSGADIITIHRREDDRHINKNDVIKLKKKIFKPLNLEMAANFDMLKFALRVKPKYVCIDVKRNSWFKTTSAVASRFSSITTRTPFRSLSS